MNTLKKSVSLKLYFKFLVLSLLAIQLQSCAAKKIRIKNATTVVNYSKQYLGTPYAWGGTSKKGIDCSGLVVNSFQQVEVYLPRTTKEQVKTGKRKGRKKLKKGDLVFFNTAKRGRKVNHVGIVTEVKGNDIKFIHASSSKGVMISSLKETYWRKNFKKARRVL
ncbi:C40 family peptidase [Psychroflexus maritimus]|uniref:C40 family peptidase n=1 Tax=Psychroflexus maritimus TaxID=2714865 RepID=A0A967DZE6_9FLAO|nr:C40 family peptidase [Psychroflexus maritimus]NGZ90123.1 C40 family peptidase [Psychroflexus maritimus]